MRLHPLFLIPFYFQPFVESCHASSLADLLSQAALERTQYSIIYDGRYENIPYPMGDVDPRRGVCTDVIIRSYRKIGTDLQQLIHEDMTENFAPYPKLWNLKKPDRNIDHRRVPNIQTFLERQGAALPVSQKALNYRPGDLVTWMLPGNKPHIGIIIDERTPENIPLVVHNVGRGPKKENFLFKYPITGHYRYLPEIKKQSDK